MKTKKCLAKFSIVTDQTDGPRGTCLNVDIRATCYLYREEGRLLWRMGGPQGDPMDIFPSARTVQEQKRNARALYGTSAWKMRDSWL